MHVTVKRSSETTKNINSIPKSLTFKRQKYAITQIWHLAGSTVCSWQCKKVTELGKGCLSFFVCFILDMVLLSFQTGQFVTYCSLEKEE